MMLPWRLWSVPGLPSLSLTAPSSTAPPPRPGSWFLTARPTHEAGFSTRAGSNVIVVTVTAEDGTVQAYTFTITR